MVMGPPPLAPEPASRLAEVETAATSQGDRLASIETTVADLQTLSSNLESTVQTAVEAAVAEVPSRDGAAIAALEGQLETAVGEVAALKAAAEAAVDPVPLLAEQGDAIAGLETALAGLQEQLTSEVQRLEDARAASVATLEDQLAGQTSLIEENRALVSSEIAEVQAALTAEITTVRGTIESANDTIAALQGQVDALKQAENRAAAAALLVRDIDRSVADGTPFADPLERLIEMVSGTPELETTLTELRPYAESGVPTVDKLRESLEALAETEPTLELGGSEWLGKTVENITDLVAVRAKDADVNVATGQLAAADQALRDGDLAGAIGTVETVASADGEIDAAAAEAWLAEARARLTAVTAQAQLDSYIRELLTATVN